MKRMWILFCFIIFVPQSGEGGKASVILGTVQNVVSKIGVLSKSLAKNYDHSTVKNVQDVVGSILENVPVIGDIISALSPNSNKDEEIVSALRQLSLNLNALSEQIDEIKDIITSMPHILSISVFQKQVAEDGREIEDCYDSYILHLLNPNASDVTFRLSECYSKFQYLRELGSILTGKSITFNQRSLFQEIISKSAGYCNGTEITNPFKYIFGLYIKGCISISMAEHLKFATSNSVNIGCKQRTSTIFAHFNEIYLKCQNRNPCDKNKDDTLMNDIVGEMTELKEIDKALRRQFPWYYFTLITTDKEVTNNVTGTGVYPSMTSLRINDNKYVTILWFPVQSNSHWNDSNSVSYHLEIQQLYRSVNGLLLTFTESTDYSNPFTTFYGRSPVNDTSVDNFRSCRYRKVYIPKSKNVPNTHINSVSSLTAHIGFIITSFTIVLLLW